VIRRARLLAVVATLAAGALGVVASTQTWLVVTLEGGGRGELVVPGAAAVPVLAPLSLAVLALGAALSIAGPVLRYVFGVLTVAIASVLGYLSAQVAVAPPVTAVASTVTAATGITGAEAVDALVAGVRATPWPALAVAASVVLLAAGVLVLATARRWGRSGRRYDSEAARGAPAAASRPHDAVDSWDDLSRGTDPTDDPGSVPR
jgi:uncharacterized membrane protein (TIGR02234 family)